MVTVEHLDKLLNPAKPQLPHLDSVRAISALEVREMLKCTGVYVWSVNNG